MASGSGSKDDFGSREGTLSDEGDIRSAPTRELQLGDTPTIEMPRAANPGGYRAGDLLWGRYRIVQHIGHGGFSEVYRGVDETSGDAVALKFLSANRSGEQFISRMKRELRLARDLTHPNIVRAYDLVEKDGVVCLVLEFVEGRTLKDVIVEDGAMSIERAFFTLSGLCSAVAAVHASGIVHRDLKPQNVILTPQGDVKLLDFGLAKTPESTGLTATGAILGTPDYMSPEQVEGKIADERSDVYSLGVIGYELMVGKPPHSGDTPIAIALQHVRSRVPDVRKSVSHTPAEFALLVKEMTEPKPANRPRTAQGVLMRLDAFGGVTAGGTLHITSNTKKSKKLRAAALVVFAVAVLCGAVFALRFLGSQQSGFSGIDIFADGVIDVAVVMKDPGVSSAGRFFLDAVCRTTTNQLDSSLFNVVEVADFANVELSDFKGSEIEQLLRVRLVSQTRPEGKTEYLLESEVINVADGNTWTKLSPYEMPELDLEAIEPASEYLSAAYCDKVAAEVNRVGEAPVQNSD